MAGAYLRTTKPCFSKQTTSGIEAPLAFMCAEADYRNCHRQLLADALGLRGWEVLHIVADTPPLRHPRTRFAVVDSQGRLAYPKDPELPLG